MGVGRPLAAGLFLFVGLALTANRYFSTRIADAGTMSVTEVRAFKGAPKLVSIAGAALDWEHRRYRTLHGWRYYSADPRVVTSVADVKDLAARGDELTGRVVQLETSPEPKNFFYLVKKSYETGKTSPTDTSIYVPADGTNAKAWIVSERFTGNTDPKTKDFLARRTHVGVVTPLYDVYDGTMLMTAYAKNGGRGIPDGAVALDTDRPVAADAAIDTIVPVVGSNDEVLALLPGTPSGPPALLTGIVTREHDRALDEAVRSMRKASLLDAKGRNVLFLGEPAEFRARNDLGRVSAIGLVLSALGLGLLLAHFALRRVG
jgi:hypothetical protein